MGVRVGGGADLAGEVEELVGVGEAFEHVSVRDAFFGEALGFAVFDDDAEEADVELAGGFEVPDAVAEVDDVVFWDGSAESRFDGVPCGADDVDAAEGVVGGAHGDVGGELDAGVLELEGCGLAPAAGGDGGVGVAVLGELLEETGGAGRLAGVLWADAFADEVDEGVVELAEGAVAGGGVALNVREMAVDEGASDDGVGGVGVGGPVGVDAGEVERASAGFGVALVVEVG